MKQYSKLIQENKGKGNETNPNSGSRVASTVLQPNKAHNRTLYYAILRCTVLSSTILNLDIITILNFTCYIQLNVSSVLLDIIIIMY